MAIYELKDAALGDVQGQGYAFPVKTFRGKEYKGVFFSDDPDALKQMEDADEVPFTGTVYDATRERNETFPVAVVQTIAAGIGQRADFVAKEQP